MQFPFPALTRALSTTYPLSRFRSFEERLGVLVFTAALLFVTTNAVLAHEFKLGDIEIIDPWSRGTPPDAKVAAGYFAIRNHGTTSDRLIAASGDIAGMTQIYEMAVDDKGIMTMREVAGGLEIPAGGEVKLKPGSFHVMFMDLKQPAKQGEPFKGTLTFEQAGTVEIEYPVEAMGGKHVERGG